MSSNYFSVVLFFECLVGWVFPFQSEDSNKFSCFACFFRLWRWTKLFIIWFLPNGLEHTLECFTRIISAKFNGAYIYCLLN